MTNLQQLYAVRFAGTGLDKRRRVWKVLCEHFFDHLIDPESTVLDLACGYGEFINHVRCQKKIAVDINPDAEGYPDSSVTFVKSSATDLRAIDSNSIDTVFTSNFLEHLSNKVECDRLFAEVKRILAPGGQFIIMGPNIKYTYRVYWDYYDHILPFSDLAVAEGLSQHGFVIERRVGRFLPFTMNNAMPTPDIAIKVYLHLRIAWRVLGKQFLIVSRKPLQ